MKMLKKALSLLLVGVITVTSLVCGSVTAAAVDDFDQDNNLYAYCRTQGDEIYVCLDGIKGSKMTKIKDKDYETVKMVFKADGSTLELTAQLKPPVYTSIYKGNSVSNMIDKAYYESNGDDYRFVFLLRNQFNVIRTLQKSTTVNVTLCAQKNPYQDYYNDTKVITVNFYNDESKIKSISHYTISEIADQTYTGKAIKPTVKVKKGMTLLKKGTDYKVSYKNNTNMGTASVTITGKGSYIGSVTLKFKILPAAPKLSVKKSGENYKISWKSVKGAKKYEIYCSDDGGKTFEKTSVSGSKTSRTLELDPDETYTFKIRCYGVTGKNKYYSAYSNEVIV